MPGGNWEVARRFFSTGRKLVKKSLDSPKKPCYNRHDRLKTMKGAPAMKKTNMGSSFYYYAFFRFYREFSFDARKQTADRT